VQKGRNSDKNSWLCTLIIYHLTNYRFALLSVFTDDAEIIRGWILRWNSLSYAPPFNHWSSPSDSLH